MIDKNYLICAGEFPWTNFLLVWIEEPKSIIKSQKTSSLCYYFIAWLYNGVIYKPKKQKVADKS